MLPLLLALSLGANASGKTLVRTNPGTTVPISGAAGLYVDSVNGNDANSGRSRSAALQTIAALLDKSPPAGSSVWLARGSHWREELTGLGAGTRVRTYGSGTRTPVDSYDDGSKPLLDASDVVASESWAKTVGRTYVYQATVTLGATATNYVRAWEDNTQLTRAASLAACDSTAGSYFPSAENTSPITLYIHPAEDDDPGANGKSYEYTARRTGFDSRDAADVRVEGIWTRRNLHNDGSLVMGRYGYAQDVLVTEGGKHSVYTRTGSALVSVEAVDRYYPPLADSLFVYNEDTPDDEGVTYTNCTARSTSADAASDGFYGHYNTSGSFGAVTYSGCSVTNLRRGLHIDPTASAWTTTWNGGTFTDNAEHIRTYASVTVNGPTLMDGATTYNIASTQAGVTVVADRVLVSTGGSMFFNAADQTFTLTNSTLPATAIPVHMNATGSTLTSTGNTFAYATDQFYWVAATGAITSDNNVFTNPQGRGGFAFHLNGSFYSWAAWQAIPRDANSTTQ